MLLAICVFHRLHSSVTCSYTLIPAQIVGGKWDELSENYSLYLEKGICNLFPCSWLGHVDVISPHVCCVFSHRMIQVLIFAEKQSVLMVLPFSDTGHPRLYIFLCQYKACFELLL